jgi:4-carboxymuconolactone decarboxylase
MMGADLITQSQPITADREKALQVLSGMLAPEMVSSMGSTDTSQTFAGGIGELALTNVFDRLWTRDAIDLKTRSLVTLGILIALRATEEMEVHFPAAIRNGATIEELEEVIYQASGYAGFPAANSARTTALQSLVKAGMIKG